MNRRLLFVISFMLILIVLISGCSAAATPAPPPTGRQSAPAADSAGKSASQSLGGGNYAMPEVTIRMVIRNAELKIITEDPAKSMEAIMAMATKYGGFVVSSNSFKTIGESGSEVPQANVVIRVQAEKLDEVLAQIRALVKDPQNDIRNEQVTGQDITKEYTDLKSRLTNLEAAEKQLQRIQESASKTEDVLTVFRELTSVRSQIETIKGQIKFYEESSQLSAINVQILAQSGVSPLSIGSWQPVGTARDALQALIDMGKFLLNLLIWLVIFFLPLGLVLFFPVRWIRRFIRKWQSTHRPVPPPFPPDMTLRK